MALVDSNVFQVVGFQNTGKTTIVSNLVRRMDEAGMFASVIKHHGHGGKPDIAASKDSVKHFGAGAVASIVEGEGTIQLFGRLERMNQPIDKLIELAAFFNPDLIILEGYKRLDYPKAVIVRSANDLELLTTLQNIQCILYWPEIHEQAKALSGALPLFSVDNDEFFTWIIGRYRK